MKQIWVVVEECVIDHQLVSEGTNDFGVIAEVSDRTLRELNRLRKARHEYESKIQEIYQRVVTAEREKELASKCKYRVRPGKWCGAPVTTMVKNADRCQAHFGIPNGPAEFEAEECVCRPVAIAGEDHEPNCPLSK